MRPQLNDRGLVVENLTVIDAVGQVIVDDVSFDVRGGEMLAIAGVQGNGQTELTEALIGLQPQARGSVTLDGEQTRRTQRPPHPGRGRRIHPGGSQRGRTRRGIHDRREPHARPRERRPFRQGLQSPAQHAARPSPRRSSREFDVRAQSIDTPVGQLSGGNQQKVVLARELSRDLSLLVAAQPTRGVDVGSIEFIHKRIVETRDAGVPVIVVSTELDEVAALADRIMVMYRGRIVGIVPGDTPREVLGLMMAGESPRRGRGCRVSTATQQSEAPPPSKWHQTFLKITQGNAIISVLAIFLALVVGGILIAVTDEDVQAAAKYFFARPGDTIVAIWDAVSGAYIALFQGAIYNFGAPTFARAIRPLTETLTFATPLIAAGLGVALAFRIGMFNIGGRGQMLLAAAAAGYVGFAYDLPFPLHMILALIAGLIAGALWAGIAGLLKARTGAHEVIVTIMLNYIAFYLVSWMLRTPGLLQAPGSSNPEDPADEGDRGLP